MLLMYLRAQHHVAAGGQGGGCITIQSEGAECTPIEIYARLHALAAEPCEPSTTLHCAHAKRAVTLMYNEQQIPQG
jgi:hypothetical protein